MPALPAFTTGWIIAFVLQLSASSSKGSLLCLASFNNISHLLGLTQQGLQTACIWAAHLALPFKVVASAEVIAPPVQGILEFVEYIYNDRQSANEQVIKGAVALLGDLASNLSDVGQVFKQKPYTISFVRDAATEGDADLTPTAMWAQTAIETAMAA